MIYVRLFEKVLHVCATGAMEK